MKKKSKQKIQAIESTDHLSSQALADDVTAAIAKKKLTKKKKKKDNAVGDAQQSSELKPTVMKKKKKKKEQAETQAAALEALSSKGKTKKKAVKRERSVDGASSKQGVRDEEHAKPLQPKKKQRKATIKTREESQSKESEQSKISDDSFFAGKDDPKHEESTSARKTPDHLHPFKVFVGNLPFTAQEDAVRALFAACGTIERFDMPLNSEGRASGNAFIYYTAEGPVLKALEHDGTDFNGRSLKVRRAERQNREGKNGKGKGKDSKGNESLQKSRNDATTIFLGGLSYDIDYDTIKRDFEECGEVEAVRMVKNQDGGFKGIAFVVFKDESGVREALKYDGDQYSGRTLIVRRAGENGKGKSGKGKAAKGKA